MSWQDIYLLCLTVGVLWTAAALILGGLHLHVPKIGLHAHGHAGTHTHSHHGGFGGFLADLINPSCAAIFLAWFGGVGYLLVRHTGLQLWLELVLAGVSGLLGATALAWFLHALSSREQPLDPADYDMVGVLGRVSSPIRPDGIGEVIHIRDGARRALCARSDDGRAIGIGEEVIVTRYEKGVGYVRTWSEMTEVDVTGNYSKSVKKELQ